MDQRFIPSRKKFKTALLSEIQHYYLKYGITIRNTALLSEILPCQIILASDPRNMNSLEIPQVTSYMQKVHYMWFHNNFEKCQKVLY